MVLDFLRRDVEPVFSYLQTCGPELRDKIDLYRVTLNPRLGTLYQQRKDFEDTVMQLNETLAAGASTLWLQFGLYDEDIAEKAEDAGLTIVMDRCLKIEHARFHGGLHLAGFNTGVISSRRAR